MIPLPIADAARMRGCAADCAPRARAPIRHWSKAAARPPLRPWSKPARLTRHGECGTLAADCRAIGTHRDRLPHPTRSRTQPCHADHRIPSTGDFAAKARIDARRLRAPVRANRCATRRRSGAGSRERLDWIKPPTQIKDVSFDARRLPHPLVRRRRTQRQRQLPRPAPGRRAATRPRCSSSRTTRPSPPQHISYRELHARVCRLGQRAAQPRRAQGRPRHHLPADDSRGRGGDAGLRAHRRDPLGGVRRLRAAIRSPTASPTAPAS